MKAFESITKNRLLFHSFEFFTPVLTGCLSLEFESSQISRKNPHGVMVKVLHCSLKVNKFTPVMLL